MGGACCKASEKPELLTSTKKIPERPKSASGARAAERRKSFVAQALRANRPGTVETIGYDEVEKLIPGEDAGRKILGEGAFGTVYRVEWRGQEAALKCLKAVDGFEFGTQMESELLIPLALVHPNVMRLLAASFDPSGKGAYLLWDLMSGGSLSDRIFLALTRRHAGSMHGVPFTWLERVQVLIDTTLGMACLHRSGFIHGDIKPENILLHGDGRAVLGDFGFCRKVDTGDGPFAGHERKGFSVGYEDPYVLEDYANRPYTIESDTYAMGVTLMQVLYGDDLEPLDELFEKGYKRDSLAHHASLLADPEAMWPEDVSLHMASLAVLCLEKKPQKRPDDRQLLEYLVVITEISEAAERYFSHYVAKLEDMERLTLEEEKSLNEKDVADRVQEMAQWNDVVHKRVKDEQSKKKASASFLMKQQQRIPIETRPKLYRAGSWMGHMNRHDMVRTAWYTRMLAPPNAVSSPRSLTALSARESPRTQMLDESGSPIGTPVCGPASARSVRSGWSNVRQAVHGINMMSPRTGRHSSLLLNQNKMSSSSGFQSGFDEEQQEGEWMPESQFNNKPEEHKGRHVFIGDIHGCFEALVQLWGNIEDHVGLEGLQDSMVVFLGDYCDRGQDTCAVIEWLVNLRDSRPPGKTAFLAGNHDMGMAAFLGSENLPTDEPNAWYDVIEELEDKHADSSKGLFAQVPGGMHPTGQGWGILTPDSDDSFYSANVTFQSYGVTMENTLEARQALIDAVPMTHKEFLQQMVWVYEAEVDWPPYSVKAVHAGLLAENVEEQLVALRARDMTAKVLQPKAMGRFENFSARAEVLDSPPSLQETLLVSGHHGFTRTTGNRVILDTKGGMHGPLEALVYPECATVASSSMSSPNSARSTRFSNTSTFSPNHSTHGEGSPHPRTVRSTRMQSSRANSILSPSSMREAKALKEDEEDFALPKAAGVILDPAPLGPNSSAAEVATKEDATPSTERAAEAPSS